MLNMSTLPKAIIRQTKVYVYSMFYSAFFNSIIDKHQQMHFFTFNTVLV